MIDVNTQAAALQNSAGLQGLMSGGPNNYLSQALNFSFQQRAALMEHQLAMARQQQQNVFAAGQQSRQLETEKSIAAAAQAGETTRTGERIASEKNIAAAAQLGESTRATERLSGERQTALAVQKAENDARLSLANRATAEHIIDDPMTYKLGIDPSKYDLNKPGDVSKLVSAYQAARTPAALQSIATNQAAGLSGAVADAKNKVFGFVNSQEGQAAMVQRMLSDPGIQNVLVGSMSTRYDASKFQAIMTQAQTDPAGALAKLNADLDSASHGAVFGMRMPDAIAAVQTGRQNAYSSLFTQPTPGMQQNLGTMQDLMQLRNNVLNQGFITDPQSINRALGNATPLTDQLKGATPAAGLTSPIGAGFGAGTPGPLSQVGAGLAPPPQAAPAQPGVTQATAISPQMLQNMGYTGGGVVAPNMTLPSSGGGIPMAAYLQAMQAGNPYQ